MAELVIHKKRTNIVPVKFSYSVANDVITSQIRRGRHSGSPLIATWTITKPNGGADGRLILTLDDSQLMNITDRIGYMDMKRVSGGEPFPMFEEPVVVVFKDSITE